MLTFEVLTDPADKDASEEGMMGPSSRLSSKAKSVNGDTSADDAASEVSASERKKRGEAAAKAIEEKANAKAKPGKQSVFREQKEAARLAEEAKQKAAADKKAQRKKMAARKKQKEKESELTVEELLILASEYRANDDFSAVGRLWKAVKNVEGCPEYGKFKRWVIEQQANDVAEKVAEKEMEQARAELAQALMALQRGATNKTLGGKKQKSLVETVMTAEKKVLDLEATDKQLHQPPPEYDDD